jgi:large subunit ribosomal protein L25
MAVLTANLTVQARQERGGRANKRLRDRGLIPGVIYGHKEAVVAVTLPRLEVAQYLDRGAHLFDLNLDGASQKVLVKEVQYDHLGMEVIHIDFARVSLDEKVKVTVPLELKGTPKGEAEGGVLQQIVAVLEVECLVTEIPDMIRHNVSEMALNDVLRLSNLKFPEGVRPVYEQDLIVATVKEILETVEAPAAVAEGAAEPELIGRKPAEGEEAEAAPAEGKEGKEAKS